MHTLFSVDIMAKSPKKIVSKKSVKKSPKKSSPKKDKVKRAPSSFMIFANENRDAVIKANKFERKQIADIGRKLGEMWNKLSQKEKDAYKAKSEARKQ